MPQPLKFFLKQFVYVMLIVNGNFFSHQKIIKRMTITVLCNSTYYACVHDCMYMCVSPCNQYCT